MKSFALVAILAPDVEEVDTENAKVTSVDDIFEYVKFSRNEHRLLIEGKAKSGTSFGIGKGLSCNVPIKLQSKEDVTNYSISLEFRLAEETSFFPSSLRIVKRDGTLTGKVILTAENLNAADYGKRFQLELRASGDGNSEVRLDNKYLRLQRLAGTKWIVTIAIPEDSKINYREGLVNLVIEGEKVSSVKWSLDE